MKLYGPCLTGIAALAMATGAFASDFINQGSGKPAAQPTYYQHSVAYGGNLVEVRMVTLADGKDFSTLVNGKVVNHFFMATGSETQAEAQAQFGSYVEASAKTISEAGANAQDFNLLISQPLPVMAAEAKFPGIEAFIKADHTNAVEAKANAKGAAIAVNK